MKIAYKNKNSNPYVLYVVYDSLLVLMQKLNNSHRHLSMSQVDQDLGHYCSFCKSNGETYEFYKSHSLKDSKGKVICPTLRAYKCPICGATGAYAHTQSYCPERTVNTQVTRHAPLKKYPDGYVRYSHGVKYIKQVK